MRSLEELVSEVLGVPIGQVSDDMTPDDVDEWDSLSHINLVFALQVQYNVTFDPADVPAMYSSVRGIRSVLAAKGVEVS